MLADVRGYCPACGGRTLHIELGPGIVSCLNPECTDKGAAIKILMDGERDHIVKVTADGAWTCRHPLHERLDDKLMACEVGTLVGHIFNAMADSGELARGGPWTYRASLDGDVFSISDLINPGTRSYPVNLESTEGHSGTPTQEGTTQ